MDQLADYRAQHQLRFAREQQHRQLQQQRGEHGEEEREGSASDMPRGLVEGEPHAPPARTASAPDRPRESREEPRPRHPQEASVPAVRTRGPAGLRAASAARASRDAVPLPGAAWPGHAGEALPAARPKTPSTPARPTASWRHLAALELRAIEGDIRSLWFA